MMHRRHSDEQLANGSPLKNEQMLPLNTNQLPYRRSLSNTAWLLSRVLAGISLLLMLVYSYRLSRMHPQQHIPKCAVNAHTYGVMLDAGSTGSRIHVYKFAVCQDGQLASLVDEVFEHTKPGLSHYAAEPHEAARSLNPLLYLATKSVPVDLHNCTPVMLRATAGLRLLQGTQA